LAPNLFPADRMPAPTCLGPSALAALESRIEEVRQMRAAATETLGLLGQLASLVERPTDFNRLVSRVEELRARVRHNERTYNLVSQVSQRAELRRLRADRTINDQRPDTPQSARRRLERDREYVAGFIDGCDYLLQILAEALQRMRESGS
jgi:hypothetical protein